MTRLELYTWRKIYIEAIQRYQNIINDLTDDECTEEAMIEVNYYENEITQNQKWLKRVEYRLENKIHV